MSSLVNVAIHPSQFPEEVRADLIHSLRSRAVQHKFHYDSVKQTQKWLALHQAFSPSRNDAECAAVYDRSFAATAALIESKRLHLVGLGCGGGQKDTRLLRLLKKQRREVFYTPCDVSTAMVLTARKTALSVLSNGRCFPLVCDLGTAGDVAKIFDRPEASGAARAFTFFGMIPNFEPRLILPKLASLVGAKDWLLFSANLAPGLDYAAGMKTILPQYDNPPTRDWLLAFLFDLGIEADDGELKFKVENVGRLKRIVASFHFKRKCAVQIEDHCFEFRAGEIIRLFFSYRYTPKLAVQTLAEYDFKVLEQWIAPSEEEGVFLCHRK